MSAYDPLAPVSLVGRWRVFPVICSSFPYYAEIVPC
jgi:hypothetical protein